MSILKHQMSLGPSVAVALAMTAVGLAGCGEDASRVEALGVMATSGAIPAYEAAADAADDFEESVGVLCAGPADSSVDEARQSMLELRLALAETEAFRHGPAMDERDQGRINTPAEPTAIEELIESLDPATFDPHYVSTSIGATRRGLYAIEYVLFAADNSASVADELQDSNRCVYLSALAGAVVENVQKTSDGWTKGGDIKKAYAEFLANSERQQDNVNTSVETSIFLVRKVVNMELAPALGLVGTKAEPEKLAEGEAGHGLPILWSRLESVDQALAGSTGLSELLGDELRDRVAAEIAAAQAKIDDLIADGGSSLHDAVANNPQGVTELHDLIVKLERTLSTEVVGELGIVVGFSDADGDSAN